MAKASSSKHKHHVTNTNNNIQPTIINDSKSKKRYLGGSVKFNTL